MKNRLLIISIIFAAGIVAGLILQAYSKNAFVIRCKSAAFVQTRI